MYEEGAIALIAAFAGIFLIIGLIGIVGYVLMALGLMRMATNEGIENPWLAWIPVGNLWIIGKLIKTIELGSNKWEQAELILVIASAASILLAAIPVIGTIVSISVSLLMLLVMYKLYKMYDPQNATLYIILSILFSFIAPGIILFKIRDNSPVEA